MKKSSGLLRNSLAQAGVRILGSLCALALTWLIARTSVTELGVFRTLFTYFLVCEFLPLLGMQTYLFREIALHPGDINRHGLHAGFFAGGVSLLAAAGLFGWSFSSGHSAEVARGLTVVALGLPATALSLVGVSILVGAGRATAFSLIQGLETLVRTLLGMACIFAGWSVLSAITVMVLCRWLVLLPYWQAVRPLLTATAARFDPAYWRTFLGQVPTFATITLLAMAMRFAVAVSLPWMLDDAAAGLFAAAYIFVDLALLVPTALTTNLVPLFSRRAGGDPHHLASACEQAVKVMALGVFPVAALTTALAAPLFAAVLPGRPIYAASASILQVVIWTCCLQAIDQVLSAALIARGRQDLDLQTLAVGALALGVLLVVLVPLWGVQGAAWALVGGGLALLLTRWRLVVRHIETLQPFRGLWRPAAASLLALAVAYPVGSWHWLAGAVVGGLTYLAALGLLGAYTRAERTALAALFQPAAA